MARRRYSANPQQALEAAQLGLLRLLQAQQLPRPVHGYPDVLRRPGLGNPIAS